MHRPGVPFRLTSVQYLLKNPAYIGKKAIHPEYRDRPARAGKEYRLVEAAWPAIIDVELFEDVQRLMAVNRRTNHNGALTVRHTCLLGGLLACGHRRAVLENRDGTGRKGVVYFYYARMSPGCSLRATVSEVEDAVLERLGTLARESGLVTTLVAETNARLQCRLPPLVRQQKAFTRQLAAVKGEATKLLGE